MTASTPNAFLTYSDRTHIAMALRIAAETYTRHASTVAAGGHQRVAEQFTRQATDALRLAAQFED